jgi:Flp pilus assembly protein TadG
MDSIVRLVRRFRSNEQGAELIEFALTFPILVVVIAGIVDFAILFQRYEVITNAAREGARVGLLPDYGVDDIQARVNSYLGQSGITGAPAPVVTYESIEVTPGGPTIDLVRVQVNYPHQFIILGPATGLLGGSGMATITLSAQSSMRREIAAAP